MTALRPCTTASRSAPIISGRATSNSRQSSASGRRFSSLKSINESNVGSLQLAWTYKVDSGEPGSNNPSGTPLMDDGVIYLSTQDHAFAIDAHTGKQRRGDQDRNVLQHHFSTHNTGWRIGRLRRTSSFVGFASSRCWRGNTSRARRPRSHNARSAGSSSRSAQAMNCGCSSPPI